VYAAVPDRLDRGTVGRLVVTLDMDGETLAQALYEEFDHALDNDDSLPEDITRGAVLKILSAKYASCSEGWHASMNEASETSSTAAQQWSEATVRRLFPELTWSVTSDRT
jgi:hypothetical protein